METIKVIHKETKEIREINAYRFNPEYHEKIEEAEIVTKKELKEDEKVKKEYVCEKCGKICANAGALTSHAKSCNK